MATSLEASLIRVCNASGETKGTGFIVSQSFACTCAHVVEACGVRPGGSVYVVFLANGERYEAEVVPDFWRASDGDDIALLRLLRQEQPFPSGIVPVLIGSTRACHGHTMRTAGLAQLPGGYELVWAEGTLQGTVPHSRKLPMLQIDARPIYQGMSGAPVFDQVTERVIGMITEFMEGEPLEWATTAETLHQVYVDLKLHLPQQIQNYVTAISQYCRDLPYLGSHLDRNLHTIYVQEQLHERSRPQNQKEVRSFDDIAEQFKGVSLYEAVNTTGRIILIGGSGAGKSTLIRNLILELTEIHLPIFVSLRGLAKKDGALSTRLADQIAEELGMRLMNPLPVNFLSDWANQSGLPWVIALDGLDEITDRNQRTALLQALVQSTWPDKACVIITTRSDGIEFDLVEMILEGFTSYDLLPFAESQIEKFAGLWFGAGRETVFLNALKEARLDPLSTTPLWLTVAATIFEKTGSLPRRRSELYNIFVNILLDKTLGPAQKVRDSLRSEFGIEFGETIFRRQRELLECIAFARQIRENVFIHLGDLLQHVPYNRSELDAQEDAAALMHILATQRNGLLIERGGEFDFIHPSVGEYLAAVALVKRYQNTTRHLWQHIVSKWNNEKWQGTVIFVLMILDDNHQDVNRFLKRIFQKEGIETFVFMMSALRQGLEIPKKYVQRTESILQPVGLVQRALNGDRGSWDTLVGLYTQLLMDISRTCGLSPKDGEEIAVSVFKRLFKELASLGGEANLPMWLVRVCLTEIRRVVTTHVQYAHLRGKLSNEADLQKFINERVNPLILDLSNQADLQKIHYQARDWIKTQVSDERT